MEMSKQNISTEKNLRIFFPFCLSAHDIAQDFHSSPAQH